MNNALAYTLFIALGVGLAGLFFGLASLEHADPASGALRAVGGIAVYLLSWAFALWTLARET